LFVCLHTDIFSNLVYIFCDTSGNKQIKKDKGTPVLYMSTGTAVSWQVTYTV